MKPHIPEQTEGAKTDAVASVNLNNETEAKQFFITACNRLKDVNNWEKVCDSDATNFSLFDKEGNPVHSDAGKGTYIRINIPGPGISTGEGYDWVRVEEVYFSNTKEEDVFYIRVRPAEAPVNNDHEVAHFFKDEATSTFMVTRSGTTITAGVHGRNEKPNINATHLSDKVRNVLVGTASLLGFSLPQWKMLVNGIVKQ